MYRQIVLIHLWIKVHHNWLSCTQEEYTEKNIGMIKKEHIQCNSDSSIILFKVGVESNHFILNCVADKF